jgi:hypothetical protein
MQKRLIKSWAEKFRTNIFSKIEEKKYEVLYSNKKSRPNFPVNILIGLEIIKYISNYSDNELLDQYHFNLLTSYAVGQDELGSNPLSIRTLYNNRARIVEYENTTGINLLQEEFDNQTKHMIEKLAIKTDIQRMDSTLIGSNIKTMSRIEIVVKVLQNFYKSLSEKEQKRCQKLVKGYIEEEADHITFNLKALEVTSKMREVGKILYQLQGQYYKNKKINKTDEFQLLSRVLDEQFILHHRSKGKYIYEITPDKDISSSSLQNPADPDATYRKKGNQKSQGYSVNVTETCSKYSQAQIITDVSVHKNNKSDNHILAERISEIKEKTPELKELITDAGYTGEQAADACEKENIAFVPTQIKGKNSSDRKIPLKDFKFHEKRVQMCPFGCIPASYKYDKAKRKHTALFKKKDCSGCKFKDICRVKELKQSFKLTYTDKEVRSAILRGNLDNFAYQQRCRLRPAIEGTMSLFKRRTRNGKSKYRGFNRVQNSIIFTAIAINFKRIMALFNMMPSCYFLTLLAFIGLFLSLNFAIIVHRKSFS